jgi:bile acid:Na+ symporter, BASS family
MTAAQWLALALQASIMLTVLGLGLTASQQDATYLLRRPKLLARAVLSMNIAMPIIAAVIATTFALPLEVKVALVALAVSPVPPIIQRKQISAGGRQEYVVGLLVAMSLLAIVLVPLTVLILDEIFGRAARITPASVAKIMLLTVLAPLLVGLLIRHWVPAAEKAAGTIIAIAGILLIVGVVLLLYGLWPITRTYIGDGVVAMLAALAVIGLAVGHLLGGPLAGDRTALAMSTSSRHPAVALAIATSGAVSEPKPELAIILLYLVVATFISLPYQKWRRSAIGAAPISKRTAEWRRGLHGHRD